ncbi:MAG: Ku protein [Propionibacteriales bacterium]|nr:Ku protein [Propionibacteriales bacterium]
MQAIWKGTISFGLVTIPVKVYSATEEKDISFRQVHEADGGRIRYKRVCEIDGEEVPYSDIGKGYEMPDGRMVILNNEDFAGLPLPTAKSIEVLEFVPAEQVDPLYFAKAYYLSADGPGAKPYVLLRDALTKTGQCALVKVAMRTKESLALLRERDGALVLQTMLWPDEVRSSEFAVPDDSVDVKKQEVGMAESYIATLTADFDPDRYHSDYREALEQLVEAKVSGLPMPEADEDEEQGAEVVDLVAALRASVDAAKKRRATGGGQPADTKKPTGSGAKSASKKTTGSAAKKSTSKSATAKKSATKRTPKQAKKSA